MQMLYLYLCRLFWKHIKGVIEKTVEVTEKKDEMRRTWRVLAVGTSEKNISYLELLWNKNLEDLDKDLIKAFQSHPFKNGSQIIGPSDDQKADTAHITRREVKRMALGSAVLELIKDVSEGQTDFRWARRQAWTRAFHTHLTADGSVCKQGSVW